MANLDYERLEIAGSVREQLAVENQLSREQARSYVRCLQATWQVPEIRWTEKDSQNQLADAKKLLHAAHIFRQIEGKSSSGATDCFRRAGEILEWLSRSADDLKSIVPIELLAGAAYQLGGLPAMASALLNQLNNELAGIGLYSAFLQADFDRVLLNVANFWRENPDLTIQNATYHLSLDGDENPPKDRISWYFTVELIRSLGLIADSLRRGDDTRLSKAIAKLQALDEISIRTYSDDASLLISLIRQVADNYRETSIYKPLIALSIINPNRNEKLLAYARDQYSRGRGILWTSQIQGLDRLIERDSFALCTPTGSGKTLVANMAIVKELLLRHHEGFAPLAIYLVPSRALAGEVEGKLKSELGKEVTITALYGGADWGITDYWLNSDVPTVLIATVEKADTLMRYAGAILLTRLQLLIIDEAHQIVPEAGEHTNVSFADHTNRSVRLENLVSRILIHRPNISRIALTAVAGGAALPVAQWIEGSIDAQPVGVRYRSTRQIIGKLETAPHRGGQIILDIMNGQSLSIKGQEESVFLPLRIPAMPILPAVMRNSLNRFNSANVLWTALHLAEEDQRVLISVTQEPEKIMRWYKEALELPAWTDAPHPKQLDEYKTRRFKVAQAVCKDYCGEESFEYHLLNHGIATSHGQMPQRLRRLMIEMIERRICPVTIATATLTEGVNLPFDIIFLTSLKRRSWDSENQEPIIAPISTAEFRNLAGRAGRPGTTKGIEGMTLVALPTQISTTAKGTIPTQRRQMFELHKEYNNLVKELLTDEGGLEEIQSPLAQLLLAIKNKAVELGITENNFLPWLETVLPEQVSLEVGEGASQPVARLADTVDELDSILLTAIEELDRANDGEMTGAKAEAHLAALWHKTFTAVAATQEAWLERAFALRGRAIVETIYPNGAERKRLYQYGFTPVIGRKFEKVAPQILKIIMEASSYGSDTPTKRLEFFQRIGALLTANRGFGFRVRETDTDQNILNHWSKVLAWWMQGPGEHAPQPVELRAWQRFVADNLEFRLGVVLGAVVVREWSNGSEDPLAVPSLEDWKETSGLPWFGFWARELLKWGTHDPFVAFTLSQGLAQTREAALQLRPDFERWLYENYTDIEGDDLISPRFFLEWERSLPSEEEDIDIALSEEVILTGTNAQNSPYSVIPIVDGKTVRWLDPAGFELARAKHEEENIIQRSPRNGYELRSDWQGISVYETFKATS
ncbi:DEAD/DEAH box helicase [Pseudomonas frederiksbergensis]|uniref:DEAD/DEAH box helicase n=1 Tax=Pseudomonas frederiksbergensis TaxID=104087 RepID=UPI003D01D6F4